jgi:integrase
MAQPKFTVYKHIKVDGRWRYCRAVTAANHRVKQDKVIVAGREETHPEGTYCIRHKGTWIDTGTDALEAQRMRSKLLDQEDYKTPAPAIATGRTPLAAARDKYFYNLEARGLDSKSIAAYRSGVDPFVETCKKSYIEDVETQDMYDFMRWLRKQPVPERRNSNPERTYDNKMRYVAIFLKKFGISKLLKSHEYPQYHEKKVVAHTEAELSLLYSHADEEERFLLDYFIGSMARDKEAHQCRYRDLSGTTLTLYGKRRKTRTVEISQRLADSINERRKRSKSDLLFPNGSGKPDTHLLDTLQDLAKKAGADFHTELHKLRKTGASRRYLAGVPLPTLMQELGHESLETTRIYLADVRKEDEVKKSVADADFVPKPVIVRTKTGG